MVVRNGICYPDSSVKPLLKVVDCRPLDGSRLLVVFNNGETRFADFTEMLDRPAFRPLADETVFRAVSIDHGVVSWMDGEIDISPEWLYVHGTPYVYPEIEASDSLVAENSD